MNPNPYKANEPEPVAESVEEEIAQEQSVWSRLGSLLGFKRDDLVDTNEVTAKEVAPATGRPGTDPTKMAEQKTFNALAPGQEYNNYDLRPLKLMHHIDPTSYDPSVQARLMDGTMIPVDYSQDVLLVVKHLPSLRQLPLPSIGSKCSFPRSFLRCLQVLWVAIILSFHRLSRMMVDLDNKSPLLKTVPTTVQIV